ncbi:MAG: DUF6165 family protein [Pseudomonadota bacterium]|uniref:DUF6165 family protein n=1 Tax=Sphingobium sp. TaxID=1912891 RepID=UPI002E1CB45E
MSAARAPAVPVSWGELLDKLTILEIKKQRIAAAPAQANIAREYGMLAMVAAPALAAEAIRAEVRRLARVNRLLWSIEDAIRLEEAAARFGPDFIRLARAVYRMNDRRAAIKRRINDLLGSELVEEKSYAILAYQQPMRRAAHAAGPRG